MEYAIARKRMVEDQLRSRGIKDQHVLQVMLKVPRHSFVAEGMVPMAYNDHPLNIGDGQTISQPYIVAYMVECLRLRAEDRILEVGTGCGYLTAILAELGSQLYTIERIPALLMKARKNLKRLGYKNIVLKVGDGSEGWKERAPFDAIIASAASPEIPRPLLDQLAEGGRLLIPIGNGGDQELVLVTKTQGKLIREILSGCRFVKLMGRYGFHPS